MTGAPDVRQAVLDTAQEMYRKGLVEGTSGNVSGRMPDGSVCVTPSSVSYETMTMEDLGMSVPVGEFREVSDIGSLARLLRRHVA